MTTASTILFVLALGCVLYGLGFSALKFIGPPTLSLLERQLSAFAIGGLILHFAVWAVGVFTFTSLSMAILFAVAAALALPGLFNQPWRHARAWVLSEISASRSDWFRLTTTVVLAALVLSTIVAGLAPPADYDGLNYHLSIPKRDFEMGRIALLPGIVWQEYFPALAEMHFRFAYALANERAAQMVHGLFGLAAAGLTACLALRLGYGAVTARVAAIMYLSIRNVVWEAGTTHNELALAMYTALSLLAYMQWRSTPDTRLMILFGLAIGGMNLTKYVGLPLTLCFVLMVLFDFVRQRKFQWGPIIGFLVGLAVFSPLLLRNYFETGNPIMPLFNDIIQSLLYGTRVPETALEIVTGQAGAASGVTGLLRSPWDIFVDFEEFSGGHQFGAPYLLMFAPLILFAQEPRRRFWLIVAIPLTFLVIWFFFLAKDIRHLSAVFPILAALAACGVTELWKVARVRVATAVTVCVLLAIVAFNQSMFVGIYVLIRWPVILGLVSEEHYLVNTPTMKDNVYLSCQFISKRMADDDRYLSFLAMKSFYCPQASAIYNFFDDERSPRLIATGTNSAKLPEISSNHLGERLAAARVKFVIVPTYHERRDRVSTTLTRADVLSGDRFGKHIAPIIAALSPVYEGPNALVFDAKQVIEKLKAKGAE